MCYDRNGCGNEFIYNIYNFFIKLIFKILLLEGHNKIMIGMVVEMNSFIIFIIFLYKLCLKF